MDLWAVTKASRRSILATFETLADSQWDQPSLCGSWTVRQVLAHLILAAKPPFRRYVPALVKARGSFDRANEALAVADANQPTTTLIDNYRQLLDHQFAPPGWPAAAPLSDVLLHTLDVRIPLGIETDEAPEHYEPVLGLLHSAAGRSFSSRGRPKVQWTATDNDFAVGTGPSVSGTMADLALTAAGRSARIDRLSGDGVSVVEAWLR